MIQDGILGYIILDMGVRYLGHVYQLSYRDGASERERERVRKREREENEEKVRCVCMCV